MKMTDIINTSINEIPIFAYGENGEYIGEVRYDLPEQFEKMDVASVSISCVVQGYSEC